MRFFKNIWLFFYDGFSSMTVGKRLWIIILVKLFIIFIVLKLIFFPNFLNRNFNTDKEKGEYVRDQLIDRK
jgi:hypothetical protein